MFTAYILQFLFTMYPVSNSPISATGIPPIGSGIGSGRSSSSPTRYRVGRSVLPIAANGAVLLNDSETDEREIIDGAAWLLAIMEPDSGLKPLVAGDE